MVSLLVVLDETLVRAGHALVFDIRVVLFVLVHEVVHDLYSAVGELHTVLACKSEELMSVLRVPVIQRLISPASSSWRQER